MICEDIRGHSCFIGEAVVELIGELLSDRDSYEND